MPPIPIAARAREPEAMDFSGLDLIRIFEHDPDLLDGLDAPVAAHLRLRLGVRRSWADPGPWQPAYSPEEVRGHLGLLIVDGLLIRTVRLGGKECSELVGPGDLIRPWDPDDVSVSVGCASTWRGPPPRPVR